MAEQVEIVVPVTQEEIDKNCGCGKVYEKLTTDDLLRIWLLKQLCPETPTA